MRRYLKFVVLCLLAAAALYLFGRNINWAEAGAAIGRANKLMIAAACACILASYMFRALRWRTLLAPIAPAGLRKLFAATTIGFGSIFLLGRPGEVVRPAVLPLWDKRVSPGASFVTIGVERVFDMSAVVLIFALNLLLFKPSSGEQQQAFAAVRVAGFIFLGLAALGFFALIVFRRYSTKILAPFERRVATGNSLAARIGRMIAGLLSQLAGALEILTDARALLTVLGWTLGLWVCVTLALSLVMRAFGLPADLRSTAFVMGFALVGSLVPTPGGAAGAFHLAIARGMMFLGVGAADAAASAIICHLVMFGVALAPGLYYFVRGDFEFAQLRELMSGEAKTAHAATNGLSET